LVTFEAVVTEIGRATADDNARLVAIDSLQQLDLDEQGDTKRFGEMARRLKGLAERAASHRYRCLPIEVRA